MLKKFQRLLSAICFCVLVLLCAAGLSGLQKDDYYSNWNDKQHAYPYQALLLGSSHIYRTIIPQLLYDDYGIEALSVSTAGQTAYHALTILQDEPDLGKYDVILLDIFSFLRPYTYADDFNHSLHTTNPELIADDMRQNRLTISSAAIRQLSETNPKKYLRILGEKEMDFPLQYFFSLFNSHSQYLRLDRGNYEKNDQRYSRNKNYDLSLYVWPLEDPFMEDYEELPGVYLNEQCEAYLMDIIKLCKKADTQLILTAIPYGVCMEERVVMNQIEAIAEENGVDYVSMETLVEEAMIEWEQDFMDIGHTNHFGALKLTDFFGYYLSDTYELEDRSASPREDSPFLQNPYGYYMQEIMQNYRYQSFTLTDYLETLYNLDDSYLLVFTTGENNGADLSEYTCELLRNLNIQIPDDIPPEGFSLMQIGTLNEVMHLSADSSSPLLANIGKSAFEIDASLGTITIDHSVVSMDRSGSKLLIYDLCSNEFTDSIAMNVTENENVYRYTRR